MPHVLIVDDDLNTRDALETIATAEGFSTSVADSIRAAQIQMALKRPDVVLADIRLPDGCGMDLFNDIESRATTQIVLITGHASVETAVEALRQGAVDYLTMPLNFRRLMALLSRVARAAGRGAGGGARRGGGGGRGRGG